MKCIYWNIKDIEDTDRIRDIIVKESPDVFFLSEVNKNILTDGKLKLDDLHFELFPNPGCERVVILKKVELEVDLSLQARYYTTLFIKQIDTFIVSVHFPSQMYQHMDALKEFMREFRATIDFEIGGSLTQRILIIGDFNVNPYEKPMIDFDGFIATNSINARKEITHLGKTKSSYYNPTWQLYSRTHFPGTKYYKRPSAASFDILEFHFLDQALISQRLKQEIESHRIDLIETTDNFTFLNTNSNSIEGSDHLPFLYEFKLL